MSAADRHARFVAVVARAMAKPVKDLPYREPVTSRYRVGTHGPREIDRQYVKGAGKQYRPRGFEKW